MKWISVKEKLPTDCLNYIGWNTTINGWQMVYLNHNTGKFNAPNGYEMKISHWLEITPPEDK